MNPNMVAYGNELVDETHQRKLVLEEAEEELTRLLRWQLELRASGKLDKADELNARIKVVQDDIDVWSKELGG